MWNVTVDSNSNNIMTDSSSPSPSNCSDSSNFIPGEEEEVETAAELNVTPRARRKHGSSVATHFKDAAKTPDPHGGCWLLTNQPNDDAIEACHIIDKDTQSSTVCILVQDNLSQKVG